MRTVNSSKWSGYLNSNRLKRVSSRWIAAVFIALAFIACATPYTPRDWSNYSGPGAAYFQKEELPFPHVDDPLEPVNRVLSAVDYGVLRYVLAPVTDLYRWTVPKPFREHIALAGENFLYPTRGLNNALQGEWSEAGEETLRFLVNTTIGVLGLFDPAKRMGLEPHPEDFGQTLAKWGWKNSTYLFLPFYGPSTIRDGLGKIPDELSDPANYVPPAAWVRRANRLSDEANAALRLVETNYDAYEPARTLYSLNRQVEVEDFTWHHGESAATETLDAIFLTFEDPEFPGRATTGDVKLSHTRDLPYSLWLQPRPAPLVYIVPGLGGHRLGNATLGLAELAFTHGNSVVTVSNPTNWEFIEHAATSRVPGFVPSDSHDLHVALDAIDRDLEARFPARFTSRRLAGISMGAMQTLFIAAEEKSPAGHDLLAFDVYLAMNPPVDLEFAMKQLDTLYNAPLVFPAAERRQRVDEILAKALSLGNGQLTPSMEIPFSDVEAKFLIGLSFRMELQFVILQIEQLHDIHQLQTSSTWLRRAPAFHEASEYSYMEYVYAYLLPDVARRENREYGEALATDVFARGNLHAVADGLRANDKVRLFSNENDFLLRAEDRAWLRDLLGDRAHFFPSGGHLGNLHRKSIQEIIETTAGEAAKN